MMRAAFLLPHLSRSSSDGPINGFKCNGAKPVIDEIVRNERICMNEIVVVAQ